MITGHHPFSYLSSYKEYLTGSFEEIKEECITDKKACD